MQGHYRSNRYSPLGIEHFGAISAIESLDEAILRRLDVAQRDAALRTPDQEPVGDAEVPGYLRNRPCRVSHQPDRFRFTFVRIPSSCLRGHSFLQFHHSPPDTGVCEIGARLHAIFDEQKIILTHSSDDDANLLKVGKLVGAEVVVFVETTERVESFTPRMSTMQNIALRLEAADAIGKGRDPLWMRMQNQQQHIPVYRPSVTVRAVRVETGEIIWSGSSTLSQAVSDAELAYPHLAQAAMIRANCPIEQGAKWIEGASDGSREPWGCIQK